jgi:hypothetical protein
MTHTFEAADNAWHLERKKFDKDVYEDVYEPKVRAAMKRLPPEFLPYDKQICVSLGGAYEAINVDKCPVAYKDTFYSRAAKVYDSTHPLVLRFRELEKKKHELQDKKNEAKSAAKAALDGCMTIKQLIEAWPEVKPFVRDYLVTRKTVALTITTKELNAHFGLKAA